MKSDDYLRCWPLALVFISSVVVVFAFHVEAGFRVCSPAPLTDANFKTITSLDAVVDLGLKLSTTLVGFGAALLLGLKTGVSLSLTMRVLVVCGIVLFAQSAIYGVWWRVGIAELQVNECFDLITSDRLQGRFLSHVNFFIAGVAAIGVIVVASLFNQPTKDA